MTSNFDLRFSSLCTLSIVKLVTNPPKEKPFALADFCRRVTRFWSRSRHGGHSSYPNCGRAPWPLSTLRILTSSEVQTIPSMKRSPKIQVKTHDKHYQINTNHFFCWRFWVFKHPPQTCTRWPRGSMLWPLKHRTSLMSKPASVLKTCRGQTAIVQLVEQSVILLSALTIDLEQLKAVVYCIAV